MVLVQGSNDYRINVAIDYQDGNQISVAELATATKLEIAYRWLSYDGTDSTEAKWTATGYGLDADNKPYIYYIAKVADVVPTDANKLVGRAIITDPDGLISKGTMFEISVVKDEL